MVQVESSMILRSHVSGGAGAIENLVVVGGGGSRGGGIEGDAVGLMTGVGEGTGRGRCRHEAVT